MIEKILIFFVHCYQKIISPYLGKRCRFEPTCSSYAICAIENHGAWQGSALMIRRLLRCHPIKRLGGGFGYDPVPLREKNTIRKKQD